MTRRSILDKPKKKKGLGWFLIVLLLIGFIVSVILFGMGWIDEIIHP